MEWTVGEEESEIFLYAIWEQTGVSDDPSANPSDGNENVEEPVKEEQTPTELEPAATELEGAPTEETEPAAESEGLSAEATEPAEAETQDTTEETQETSAEETAAATNVEQTEEPEHAIWSQPKAYTVKFDLYGGTGTTPEPITVTQPTDGSEVYVQMPAQGDIAKEGCTFAGWTKNPEEYVAGKGYGWNATYYDPDDGDSKTTTDMMHITAGDSEEITLYPAWLPNKSRGGFIYFAIRRDGTLMTEPAVYEGAEYTFLSRKEYYYDTMQDAEKRVDCDAKRR